MDNAPIHNNEDNVFDNDADPNVDFDRAPRMESTSVEVREFRFGGSAELSRLIADPMRR